MNAIGTKLKDAYIITTQIFEDKRGSLKVLVDPNDPLPVK
jgi:dTDP-4-dehydrorhamnose 3,5-epimerase-like enzyme